MKKIFFAGGFFVIFCFYSIAQNRTATLSVDKIDISGIKSGEEVSVPVRLNDKSDGKILGFQLFIDFDHNKLEWPGNIDDPLKGVKSFYVDIPYEEGGWVLNDNGNQVVILWDDPGLVGKEIPLNIVLFELVFIYKGNLVADDILPLVWGQTYEIVDDRLAKGPTEMYDENGEKYILTLKNGEIQN